MLRKFILLVLLLNTISIGSILLISETSYSFRGIYTEQLLWIFTRIFNTLSSIFFLFLIIFQLLIKRLERKYITIFLVSLLSYPGSFIYYVFIIASTMGSPISVHDYVSPSGQKSMTLALHLDRDRGCYYDVYVYRFIFDKLEKSIDLPIREGINSNTIKEFCGNYQKATKITWLNDESQVEIKINIERDFQVETQVETIEIN